MVAQNDWAGAIKYYRDGLEADPGNVELRGGYFAVAERAVAYFADRARRFSDVEDLGSAEGQITQGLIIVPNSTILRQELERLEDMRRARAIYRDALVESRLGRNAKAMEFLEKSLGYDPNYVSALRLFDRLTRASQSAPTVAPIRLQTGAPVSINFKNASFKEAALALGMAYGVNMIFDADLADRPISIFAENVEFSQAFELLLKANRAFYRRLGKNSVVIAPDNPAKRAEYQDYLVRTFFLKSADAQEMADMLTRSLGIQTVSVNTKANTITVRDTREKLALADRLLNVNDREPAEVVLEVEILEVNRTKSEQLGLSFGSQITVTAPSITVSDVFPLSDAGNTLNASAVTLPAATFRFFKQDVDARTLASPRIRTVSKREATIHVGDRVPLRASTILDANGRTQTTYEYRDIGIKLSVTPEVHLNGTVTVDLRLEVSSLGQNLGTVDDPAFVIGTRNITTTMVLDDGETAIIGGLIRDEDRSIIQGLPGAGKKSIFAKLFRDRDSQTSRTDILLTLTPRVVRRLDLPSIAESQFYSGTGTVVTDRNPFDFLAGPGTGSLPTIRLDLSGTASGSGSAALRSGITAPSPTLLAPTTSTDPPVLAFVRSAYETKIGETVNVAITASGFPTNATSNLVIRFRTDLLEVVEVATSINIPYRIDNKKGEIRIELTPNAGGAQTREIAKIQFRGLRAGLSFLVFANSVGAGGLEGLPKNVELRASRITVR